MPRGRIAGARAALAGIVAVLAVLAVLVAPVAVAQEEQPTGTSLDISVESVTFDDDVTQVVVDVAGVDPEQVDASMFSVTEDGAPVGDLSIGTAGEVDTPSRAVMIAIDTSDSTSGQPRQRSIAAAKEFATTVMEREIGRAHV